MPRSKKIVDISNYMKTRPIHWTEISKGNNYDPGKANIKPKVQYLHPAGYDEQFIDHVGKCITIIHYDEDYVMQYYYQKIVVGMGWEESDGTIREDILKRFLDRFYEYCCQSTQVKKQQTLEQQLQTISDSTGKSVEEIQALLFGALEEEVFLQENTPSTLEALQGVLHEWENKVNESKQKSSKGEPSERYKFTAQLLEQLKQVIE